MEVEAVQMRESGTEYIYYYRRSSTTTTTSTGTPYTKLTEKQWPIHSLVPTIE